MIRFLHLNFLVTLFTISALISTSWAESIPYRQVLDKPVTFSGVRNSSDNSALDSIPLGFFLPSVKDDPNDIIAKSILEAANQLVEKANAEGGYYGIPFTVVHRTAESPWKGGPSEILKLIYEDNAVIIFTSLSAESHIAAQIAAKAYIPVISIASGDATINQARLPWVFRLLPDNTLQARVLLSHCSKAAHKKIGVISTTDQDSRLGANDLIDTLEKEGLPPLFHYQLIAQVDRIQGIGEKIKAMSPEALFVSTTAGGFLKLLTEFNTIEIDCPLYLTWIPGLNFKEIATKYRGRIISVSPVPRFQEDYENSREVPDNENKLDLALFRLAYDGIQLAIKAILKSGPQRTTLQQTLADGTVHMGLFGKYQFDNGGSNVELPYMLEYQ
jgi:ABC-type branched-subunit amino acid transport system substrate-binding protein